MTNRYILDACALIAYLNDEEGADIVENLLDEAETKNIFVAMGKVNLLEVYYGLFRELGKEQADEILDDLLALPIQIVSELSDELFREAARIKALYKVSLADSLALGLASITGDQIATSDHHEFDIVESKETIRFFWIR